MGRAECSIFRASFGDCSESLSKLAAAVELAEPAGCVRSFVDAGLPLEEVLRLIAQGLSNQEIAERLVVALDTVKGHNQRIFSKLQVQRRTEAVARARELGLL